MSEQWKTNGNCAQCRRQKYCKTECTKAKREKQRRYAELMQLYMRQLMENAKAANQQIKEEKEDQNEESR